MFSILAKISFILLLKLKLVSNLQRKDEVTFLLQKKAVIFHLAQNVDCPQFSLELSSSSIFLKIDVVYIFIT